MSVVEVLNVKLQRTDPSVSWGFNVQGGKEFHCPLMIQKVNPGSLAERCSMRPNDYILRIGSLSTEHLTHNQSRDSIVRQGNNLELTLQRGAPPRPDDFAAKLDFSGQHQLMNPENVQQKSLSPQVGVQLGRNKALLTQSYNSPMGLYSSQNIADTLVTSMKGREQPSKLLSTSLLTTSASVSSEPPSSSPSTSTSPVSNLSSSLYSLIEPKPFELSSYRSAYGSGIDLNTRPKPFVKKSVTSGTIVPMKQASVVINQDFLDVKKIENESKNDDNINNNSSMFRAVPLNVSHENEGRPSSKNEIKNTETTLKKEDKTYSRLLSDDDPLKKVKVNLKNELQTRLNPNIRHNKENTAINGRLFYKQEPRKFSVDFNNNETKSSYLKSLTKRNKSLGNVYKQIDDLNTSPSKDLTESQSNLLDLSNQDPTKIYKPKSATFNYSANRRSIATLQDPTKQSCTQSRTFKLLQETLDNGLVENNVLVRSSFLNKNQIKRCSLTPHQEFQEDLKNGGKNIINAKQFAKSDSTLNKDLGNKSLEKQKEDLIDDEKNEETLRKKYIRSLSIAKDPDAEPSFLMSRLNKENRNSVSFNNNDEIPEIDAIDEGNLA